MELVETGLRVQVVLPPDLGARVRKLAEAEHRPVRFQIERLVIEALRARDEDEPPTDRQPDPMEAAPVP
jgi:hypothetical protein